MYFITFEGIEGSGKSTQHRYLVEYLRSKFPIVHSLKEPGSTRAGNALRNVVLTEKMTPLAEAFVFSAARNQLVEEVIAPALKRNEVVVCDRYVDTMMAMQSARGVSVEVLRSLSNLATHRLMPHFTIYLDIDPEAAHARKYQQEEYNFLDAQVLEYGNAYREAYRQLIAQDAPRWIVVPASVNRDHDARAIHDMIVRRLETMFLVTQAFAF